HCEDVTRSSRRCRPLNGGWLSSGKVLEYGCCSLWFCGQFLEDGLRSGGWVQLLIVDHIGDARNSLSDPAREVARAETAHHVLVDDALGGEVGQRAFEPVTDLDAQLVIVLGDNNDYAVIDLVASDLPVVRDPQGILLDRFGLRRRYKKHHDLAALARFKVSQS